MNNERINSKYLRLILMMEPAITSNNNVHLDFVSVRHHLLLGLILGMKSGAVKQMAFPLLLAVHYTI